MTRHHVPRRITLAALVLVFASAVPAAAHTIFSKAFKEHYDLKLVTCYACHKKGKDPDTGKLLGKEHFGAFGEAISKELAGQGITAKIEAAKEAEKDVKDKVNAEAVDLLLKALEKIEQMPSPDGRTWKALIDSGELPEIKRK